MKNIVITIPKWDDFQHYKNRTPPWIKLHRSLLDNREWANLPDSAARLLPELWLLASESEGGRLHTASDTLAWRLRRSSGPEIAEDLKTLEEAGFIDISEGDASTVLADRKHDASAEGEGEIEQRESRTTSSPTSAREGGLESLLPESPHAVEVVESLEHKGSMRGTVATLRTSFLYDNPSMATPDPSVKGKDVAERRELVSRALMEMQDQGIRQWSSRALAGFIRRLDRGGNGGGRNTGATSGEGEDGEGGSPFGDPGRYHFGNGGGGS